MVNSTISIFGFLNNGYTQYPNNYAKYIFQNFAQLKSKSQIVIYRNNKLMYYGYVRKLDNCSQYIGFCVLLNDVMFSNISALFALFENAIAELVLHGDIIALNEQGDIISKTSSLVDKLQEVKNITTMIKNGIDGMESYIKSLPPVNYFISNTWQKVFVYSRYSNDAIVDASCKCTYTYVLKDKGCDTASLLGYKGVIIKLQKEKDVLSNKSNTPNKSDKQDSISSFMVGGLLGAVIIVLVLALADMGVRNSTRQALEELQSENGQKDETIQGLNSNITALNGNICDLETSLSLEQSKREKAEAELDSLKKIYLEQQPLLVKSTSFDFDTGWLSFDYYGYCDQTVKLEVRAFGDYSYYNSMTFTVEKGHHSASIYLNSNLDRSCWYSFELLIGNKIIGGDRH